jgi:nicotinate (nicotinamide) nucleotide adenylyltransferase
MAAQLREAKGWLEEGLIDENDYAVVKQQVVEALASSVRSYTGRAPSELSGAPNGEDFANGKRRSPRGEASQAFEFSPNGGNGARQSLPFRSKRQRVAILGGSFDPITDGHLKMAAEVIHMGVADEVWITPCGSRPDKPSLRTSALDRYLMCHLAVNTVFSSDFPIKVCAFELGKAQAYATVDLLALLDVRFPEYHIMFVVGSDLLTSIPSWSGGDPKNRVLDGRPWYRMREIIVISRPGQSIPHDWAQGGNITILNSVSAEGKVISVNISSSEIRRRMTSTKGTIESVFFGKSTRRVEGLLPLAVSEHISKYNLLDQVAPFRKVRDNTIDEMAAQFGNETVCSPREKKGEVLVNSRRYNITVETSNNSSVRRRIAIFGGIFDPITDGHCKMAAEVIHSNKADEVWIVPCGPRVDRPDLKTSAIDRFIMCHLAVHTTFSSNMPIKVCPIEVFENESITTPALLKRLKDQNPNKDFSFVAGSDLLSTINTWARPADDPNWYETQSFLIIPRPLYDIPESWSSRENVEIVSSPLHDGETIATNNSSTEVRRRMALPSTLSGIPVSRCLEGLVSHAVIVHIRRYGLYTETPRVIAKEIGEVLTPGSSGANFSSPNLHAAQENDVVSPPDMKLVELAGTKTELK